MLGRLTKGDLRTEWKHEALDFTSWLSKDENLAILGDEIGIEMKLIKSEAPVGSFSADILAMEENTGRKIIIENQLEATDHKHLGQVITYASGRDAAIIIWVVEEVREEHRRAIDWLNSHTDDSINLFAVKIELWKIGDSPYAPKFQVISRPNDWAKAMRSTGGSISLSNTKLMQFEFWDKFKEYAENNGTKLRLRKTYPQHWYDISYGSSESHISLTVNMQSNLMGCEIYIPDSKKLFQYMLANKAAIEEELGYTLEWMELEGKKASRIRLSRDAEIEETEEWSKYFIWFLTNAEKFHNVFGKYAKGKK